MTPVETLINQLEATALAPGDAVRKSMIRTGKKAIGCFPIYTPEEIVYAAGYLPVGMWGGKTEIRRADKYLQGFCCSIMRANLEFGLKGTYNLLEAVILPTFCDTLKCICENWKVGVPQIPVIPMVYPQNRLLEAGFSYLMDELDRVKSEIETFSGEPISELALEEAFQLYETYREVMRNFVKVAGDYPHTIDAKRRHLIIKAGYFMDKKQYMEIIRKIVHELQTKPVETYDGAKIVGTGLIGEPVSLLEIFAENKLAIVADDFAHESRQFRTQARTKGSALEKMAYRIIDQRGDSFLYEESKTRGKMLIEMVRENHADALVVFMMKFCDPEEFDYPILKAAFESANIPVLYLEVDQQMDSFEQARTRVQSFAEMLGTARRQHVFGN